MKPIIFLSLLVLCLSAPKKTKESKNASDIFANIKKAIYQCVSSSEEASKQLKELVNKNLHSNENLPLNFHSIELTQEDREIIRKCKRDAFKAPTRKPDNNVTPISLENIVHKRKKITLVKGQIRKPRKLELMKKIRN